MVVELATVGARAEQPDSDADLNRIRALLEQVTDPEIPVLTLADLGVLRDVFLENGRPVVVITPTYSGCPAMHAIEEDILTTLRGAGYDDVEVRTRLAPAWTTDWMSAEGRRKLQEYGIAPPGACAQRGAAPLTLKVTCPHCKSLDTELVSEYGSTACKALYRCRACLEPFDYFKPI
jgi:ring-1,2-phenylacetyl-CoA epoxidase subunit PaaD